jgi:uncharacterized damage-inducible protein DinB
MPLAKSLVAELTQESKSTVRMLERVPVDKLSWAPHPKSMTLGRLAWHLVSIPVVVTQLLATAAFDLADARPPQMPEQPDLVGAFSGNIDRVRDALASMDDDALRAPFALSRRGVLINEIPKQVMIRSILLNHSYHHRGQLSVYLRLLDVPVPAIYGTSADEPA